MDIMKKIMASPDDLPSDDDTDESPPQQKQRKSKPRSNSNGRSKRKEEPIKKPNEEVDLLRKEIEEMKFYQELEQTEYQEMKEKMHTYEKQMKEMEKMKKKEEKEAKKKPATPPPKSTKALQKIDEESEFMNLSNVDTSDLINGTAKDSSKKVKNGEVDLILQRKLLKRDTQIQALKSKLNEKVLSSKESSGKLKILAKEYEKRLHKMEKLKDEEIEEIKDHYKQIMETLAKQVQKVGKRNQEEIKKNSDLRSMMEEMRSDMAKREKELEKKIKLQTASMKKNEVKLNRAESKLDRTGSKYSSIKNELDETLKSNKSYSDRLKELEEMYDKDIKDLQERADKDLRDAQEKAEKELRDATETHEREVSSIQESVDEEISSLTAKLVDMEKLFDEEAAEHDKTMNKLHDIEALFKEKESEFERVAKENKKMKDGQESSLGELQEEIKKLTEQAEEKREAYEKHKTEMAAERITLQKELKKNKEEMHKIEQELHILNDDKLKKNKNLKKKSDEIGDLHKVLESIKESQAKELKLKDIEFVKARKKWTMSEQKLKDEINELKEEQVRFEALQETESGHLVVESAAEDKKKIQFQTKLIEQLKADKASLQLSVATLEGKANTEITSLQKELTKLKRRLSSTNYERRLEKKMESQGNESDNTHNRPEEHGDSRGTETRVISLDEYHHDENNESIADESLTVNSREASRTNALESISASSEESTVPVSKVKTSKRVEQRGGGITSQKSYRNYVRNRKFSSKKNVVSVNNE